MFERIANAVKTRTGSTLNVYRWQITVTDTQDTTTGWYTVTYTSTPNIEMVIYDENSRELMLNAGTYVVNDAVGITVDYLKVGDYLQHYLVDNLRFFEVSSVKPRFIGDDFRFYVCHLTQVPFHVDYLYR
jgi:hypothetical protein